MSSPYSEYKYDSLEHSNAESGRHLTDFLIRLVKRMDGIERICDLGCGNGYLAGRLAGMGYHVTGIDASQSGVELARKAYISDKVEFICTAIDDSLSKTLLNNDNEFDLVISGDVIEHLYRPSVLLNSAFQILRPAGHLILGTPYHGYLKNIVFSVLNKWDKHHGVDWDGGHIKFFSVKTLGSLLARHDFINMNFYFCGRLPWLWKNMICHARKP